MGIQSLIYVESIAGSRKVVRNHLLSPKPLNFPWILCLASAESGRCGSEGGPTLIPVAISMPAFMIGTQGPEMQRYDNFWIQAIIFLQGLKPMLV